MHGGTGRPIGGSQSRETVGGPRSGRRVPLGRRPLAAALTPPNLYWANENGNDIGEASLDGTNVTQEFIAGAHSPFAVVVDGQHIYWSNINFFAEPSIGVANLDGTSVNQTLITGVNSVGPIAVNGQHIFFSEADSIGEA